MTQTDTTDDLLAELERLIQDVARVRNSTYKVRQLAAEGDHYTINLSDDADGCLAGAMAIYDKMRHRLVTGED